MANSINISKIREEVAKSGAIGKKAYSLALDKFNIAKGEMIQNFDDHPVTVEINKGAEAENITNTLANYNSKYGENGNLFSFLGFEEGDKPTEELRKALIEDTILVATPTKVGLKYRFIAKIPSKEDILKASPTPWRASRSWVTIVEKGHGGFNYFLYKLHEVNTRSRRGVQAKGLVRETEFRTIPYTSAIIDDFIKRIGTSR